MAARHGKTVHELAEGPLPPIGERVTAEIDWDRRHTLMRTHTALHALSGIVFRDYGAKVTGGNMEPGIARMDFELGSISQEFGRFLGEGRDLFPGHAFGYEISVYFCLLKMLRGS